VIQDAPYDFLRDVSVESTHKIVRERGATAKCGYISTQEEDTRDPQAGEVLELAGKYASGWRPDESDDE
jgi:hypothetical protein